jgi:hypothetical protein
MRYAKTFGLEHSFLATKQLASMMMATCNLAAPNVNVWEPFSLLKELQ